MSRTAQRLAVALIPLLLAACASTPAPAPSEASELAERQLLLVEEALDHATHWARNSAEHDALYAQTYRLATARLEELVAVREPGTWAVSADADETLVDNSLYQVEIAQRGETYGSESWAAWVARAEATALPGSVAFARKVRELGGVFAVVTNRKQGECNATADNLRAVNIEFDILMCRGDDGEKESRWDALEAGTAGQWPGMLLGGESAPGAVEIILWVGDNIGDFPDLDQEVRFEKGKLKEFGDRFFVLPNPMYGSWDENPRK